MANNSKEMVMDFTVKKRLMFYPIWLFCYIFKTEPPIGMMVSIKYEKPRFK